MSPVRPSAGQRAGPADELVGHQVVADERHPAVDQAAAAGTRRAPRPGAPAPRRPARRTGRPRRPSPTSRPCPACRPRPCRPRPASGWATVPASMVVVTPLVTASTQARVAESSSSSPVWAACTGTAQAKIASPGGQVVGDRRADQAVAGEVLVGVDEARRDDRARAAEGGHAGVAAGRLGPVDHAEDRPVRHEDGGVDEDRPRRVHREHVVAGHDEVRGLGGRQVGRGCGAAPCGSNGQTVRPSAGTANLRACPGPSCSATTRPCSGTGTPSPAAPTWPASRSAVTLLGRDYVVWRDGDAAVVAAPDRCPHREAPLSLGRLVDGDLECAYHGWRFGRGGRCVLVPSAADGVPVPPKAHLGDRPCRRALRPRLALPRRAGGRHPGDRATTPTRATAGSTSTSSAGRPRPPG